MTNKELLEKLKEDMEMRGFSHYRNGDGSDFHKRNINKKQNSTNKYKIM